jgi:uncharacterized membrane protein YqhA
MSNEQPPSWGQPGGKPGDDHGEPPDGAGIGPGEPSPPPYPGDAAEVTVSVAWSSAGDSKRDRPSHRGGQDRVERGLSLAQLTVLLPVVALLLSGIGAFIYGSVYFVHSIVEISRHPFVPSNLRFFLTEIDVFLIGATLIIAGFGLYELFIRRIDPANMRSPLPGWLEMNDLNDLKARVIAMLILVIAVTFVDVLLDFAPQALDVLYVGGGVALVIGALTVYLRFGPGE